MARAYARPLAVPVALAALLLAPNARADWSFVPTLDLRQTYTDNVALQRDGLAESQLVTEITPGMRVKHNGPRLVVNAAYQLQYFAMQDHDVSGTNRTARRLSLDARGKLIDDLLYVDATANRGQQNISPFGQTVSGNEFASANRTEVTTWRVSPYLVHRFGSTATLETRYARDSVDAGRTGLGNTTGDSLSVRLDSGKAFRTIGWGVQVSGQTIDEEVANDTTIKAANASLRYIYTPKLSLTSSIGYDSYDYTAVAGKATAGKAWNAGFAWTPSSRTSLTATLGRRYYGPSRSLKALHRSRHSVWNISYDDAVSSTRANFLIPAAIDTASLLDDLFRASYPDPAERARAVQAYMLATGLPPSMANNINYFSNRYSLQKQLRGTVGFKQGRTSASFSLYRVRRDALSIRETDSPILGSNLDTINDNTDQRGFATTWDYRLTGRTRLNLLSEINDNKSLSTGLKARNSSVRFSARHQLRAKMSGTIELRHIEGAVLGGHRYTENALAASLSMQL